jgi:predicted nucleic acid-binding protein
MILLDTNVLIYASTDRSPFLPDFFIGAHAQIMGWPLATADEGRFRTYFPSVILRTP